MSRFVVLAPNRWDCVWMNRQQIFSASCAAALRSYSTGALNLRQSRARERPSGSERVARPGEVLVDEPPSLLRRVPRIARWDRFVVRCTVRRWRRLAGPPGAGPLIAYVFHPKFWPYIEDLDADYLVYRAYHLFERNRGWSKTLDVFERLLIQRADLAISSSGATADAREQIRTCPDGHCERRRLRRLRRCSRHTRAGTRGSVIYPETAHRLYGRPQSEGGFRVDHEARAPKAPVAIRPHWRGSNLDGPSRTAQAQAQHEPTSTFSHPSRTG